MPLLEAFCFQAVPVSIHPCMITYWKFVNTLSYKPLAGIYRNVQLKCSLGRRWTDQILRSECQRLI